MSSSSSSAAEQQAASAVFDSLTPQQKHDLQAYAESLLKADPKWNSDIRQAALKAVGEARNNNTNNSVGPDVDKLTNSLMPSALSRMPQNVRQTIVEKLREMLLAPQ